MEKKFISLIRPNYPLNCLTLDLTKIPNLDLKGLRQILFVFNKDPKYQVEVHMEDREDSLSIPFNFNKFRNFGPTPEILNLSKNVTFIRIYAVQFHQIIHVENDPGKNCTNYVEKSYDECNLEFIRSTLENGYPAGFMPVWGTSDPSQVTTSITGDPDSFENGFRDILNGFAANDCKQPCTTTYITTMFLEEKNEEKSVSKIVIAIDEHVSITVRSFPEFSLAAFLSALGGSMGLWLGLGVVQTIEIMTKMVWRKMLV